MRRDCHLLVQSQLNQASGLSLAATGVHVPLRHKIIKAENWNALFVRQLGELSQARRSDSPLGVVKVVARYDPEF